jgi:transcriptional regulator with XRE-family HTH domain
MRDIKLVVSENVKRLRGGRTLQDVASDAGISTPFLSDIEKGKRSCSLESLQKLASALDVEIADLLSDPQVSRQRDVVAVKEKI